MTIARFSKIFTSFILILSMLMSFGLFYTAAEGTHGFYMKCSASVTDHKSDGFMIDFYSDSPDGLCTYWANVNWNMYTTASIRPLGYKGIEGGGAYAGLQIRGSSTDRVGIMSMWRWQYRGEKGAIKYLYAESMMSNTTKYDNEGSGTSCISSYNWKSGQWYRELLYSWTDEETGYTFIGTWFYDYEADKWTLFTYYNTFLVDSYINTDCDQFLENFSDVYNDRYRSLRYRGVYFLPHEGSEWVSQPNVYLYSDGNVKAVGEAKLGQSEDGTYVWASVDGSSSIDTDEKLELRATLVQDEHPTFGTPTIKDFSAKDLTYVTWTYDDHSTPQLSYDLEVIDRAGNVIASSSGTRPNVNKAIFKGIKEKEYKATLTIKDVFGQETTVVYTTPDFDKPLVTPMQDLAFAPAKLIVEAML